MMKHEAYKKRFSEKSEKRFLFEARLRTIKMECLINIPFLLHLLFYLIHLFFYRTHNECWRNVNHNKIMFDISKNTFV